MEIASHPGMNPTYKVVRMGLPKALLKRPQAKT
jgi:hypothetical protein